MMTPPSHPPSHPFSAPPSKPLLSARKPPLHGDAMRDAVKNMDTSLNVIVDEIALAGECSIVTAAPAVGKTTLGLQLTFHISTGTPAFGILGVPRPAGVIYVAFETSEQQYVSKRRKMSEALDYNPDLIWFDAHWSGLNVKSPESKREFLDYVRSFGEAVKVVVIDPAYKTVSGGLSKDEEGNSFTRFLGQLQSETGVAVIVFHHTHREKWENGKVLVESNPSFGSQWLIAHPTIMWNITKWEEGTLWTISKDREGICRKELRLTYDPLTLVSHAGEGESNAKVLQKVLGLIKAQKPGVELTTKQVATMAGCSSGSLRNQISDPALLELVEFVRGTGRPTVWKVRAA